MTQTPKMIRLLCPICTQYHWQPDYTSQCGPFCRALALLVAISYFGTMLYLLLGLQ